VVSVALNVVEPENGVQGQVLLERHRADDREVLAAEHHGITGLAPVAR
jgi:hypothetical protein